MNNYRRISKYLSNLIITFKQRFQIILYLRNNYYTQFSKLKKLQHYRQLIISFLQILKFRNIDREARNNSKLLT